MLNSMRISMPDRPGMLAQVTAALAGADADIVTIEVVERSAGLVVDELCVEVPVTDPMELSRAVEAVPGVVLESLRAVQEPPTRTAALELAARLAVGVPDPVDELVVSAPAVIGAAWSVALTSEGGARPRSLARSAGAPLIVAGRLPWLPLTAPRRLAPAGWMPTSWRMRAALGSLELAAWPLGRPDEALLVGRHSGRRFRASELRQMELLVAIALAGAASQPDAPEDSDGGAGRDRRARVGATLGGSPGILG